MNTIEDILAVIDGQGSRQYGREAVSQREHALQCAQLAEQAGAPDTLVVAALLHDFGHLVNSTADTDGPDVDDVHQYIAIPFLRPFFPPAVLEPIRMHVEAKRYLCRVDPAYWAGLSDCSKHTLKLQGGIFSEEEAAQFIQRPFAADAVKLRIWDDRAKTPGLETRPTRHYAAVMARCLTAESVI
ncbi:MAG: HD domain-containing protein [Burkholderiales bacterium]|nr:HD domain-containing protein [Burkholderiales bacterium]